MNYTFPERFKSINHMDLKNGSKVNQGDVLFLKEEITNKDYAHECGENIHVIGYNVLNESTGQNLYIDIYDLWVLKEF